MCCISVIIPFYKTPIYKLRYCIESFRKQSFSDFELLLIDDGNIKDYDHLKQTYLHMDKRVHFIYQKNSGVSAARNKGLELAKGDYIVFCDSDDFVDNNYLFSLYTAIQGHDMAICGVSEQWFPSVNMTVDIKVFCSTPSQFNWVQYVNFSVNKIYKNVILQEHNIRFDSGIKLGEDALFLIKYFKYCKTIRCIADRLYHYVPNETSATHTYYADYWDWEKNVIDAQYKLFTKYPLCANEKMFLQRWLYIKIKGALFYYLRNEKNTKNRNRKVKEIINSTYYPLLFDEAKNNKLLSRIDQTILLFWEHIGANGIKLSNWISLHRWRMRK